MSGHNINRDLGAQTDRPFQRSKLAVQDAQQSGLAAAVGTEEEYPFPRRT